MDEQMIERAIREKLIEINADPPYHAAELAAAAHSVMAGKVAELEGALRDLRENINAASLVRNPVGKRVRDRADAALAPYPERRSERHE